MHTTEADPSTRRIALPGSYNIRDLGGYPTASGRSTRWRAVLRADSLHGLETDAQATLLRHGVKTIIDLRRTAECEHQPNVFATAAALRYTNIPLLPTTADAAQMPDLTALYRYMLDSAQPQLRAVLGAVGQAKGGVLVHCTAGKDRTGVVVALLLGIAGVPGSIIVDDYVLTGAYIAPLLERLRAEAAQGGRGGEQFERMLACRPEDMARMLDYLQERYGGAVGYAETIGVSHADVAAIRNRLIA